MYPTRASVQITVCDVALVLLESVHIVTQPGDCVYCLHYREQYKFAKSEATVVDQKVRLASGMCMWSDFTKEYSQGLTGNSIHHYSLSLCLPHGCPLSLHKPSRPLFPSPHTPHPAISHPTIPLPSHPHTPFTYLLSPWLLAWPIVAIRV